MSIRKEKIVSFMGRLACKSLIRDCEMASLGQYIAHQRDIKGWSQRELARRANISFMTVQAIETGDTKSPGIQAVISIADALNIPVQNLILAYQGKDPEAQENQDPEVFQRAISALIESLGLETLEELYKLRKEKRGL